MASRVRQQVRRTDTTTGAFDDEAVCNAAMDYGGQSTIYCFENPQVDVDEKRQSGLGIYNRSSG